MKTKQFKKKLVLNKTTIVHLDNLAMKAVDGGDLTCETNDPIHSCITFNGYTCHTCVGYTNCRTCGTGEPVCDPCTPLTYVC